MYLFYVGLHVNVSWKYIRLHDVAWNVPGDCLFIVFCHLSYVNKFSPSFFTYFYAQKHEEMHQHYIILEFKLFLYKFKSEMILMNLEFRKKTFCRIYISCCANSILKKYPLSLRISFATNSFAKPRFSWLHKF